jgi:hypothetical protein
MPADPQPQEVGNSFLRGFFGSREMHLDKASNQTFMVADQSNPGFKEDLMR